jgi:hypothetical protein
MGSGDVDSPPADTWLGENFGCQKSPEQMMDFSSCAKLIDRIDGAGGEKESSRLLAELDAGLRANPAVVREKRSGTLLHEAVRYLRPDVARLLLQYGADPNTLNDDGDVPLGLLLVEDEYPQSPVIAEALLKGGADPTSTTARKGRCFTEPCGGRLSTFQPSFASTAPRTI